METKFNFTIRRIDMLPVPPDGKRAYYFDTQIQRLQLQMTSSGVKTFFVRKKIGGRSERILLGHHPDLSIEQVRKKATQVLSEIAQGKNPQDDRKAIVEEPTIGQTFTNYLDGHARARCVRVHDMEQDFRRYLSDWKNRKLTSIKRTDVQTRINTIKSKHGPATANHVIILMKAAMNWNIKNGAFKGENPWSDVKQFKVKSRERFLTPDELKRFFSALQRCEDSRLRDYVLLSLYTGARRMNVLSMRWDQVNLELGLWTIPITKNGDSQTVPLTQSAIQILETRSSTENGEWVLPGKTPANHLVEPKRPWYKLLKAAQIDDFRLHDLRRTLGSYMAIGNHSLQIIGKALGHKSSAATEIYSRLSNQAVRQAMEGAQSDIHNAAGIKPNKTTRPKLDKKRVYGRDKTPSAS